MALTNLPPDDADPLRERLAEEQADLLERRDELLAGVENVPEEVSEENAGRVTDFIKQLAACIKNANGLRVAEKEPYLEGGRKVDGFFKGITDPLDKGKRTIEARLNVFLRAKAEEERKIREAEAQRQREEAERLAKEAAEREKAITETKSLEDAIAAEAAAEQARADALKAAQEAAAKPADLSRTRGDYGGVASLRTFWDFEIIRYEAIPLHEIQPHIPREAIEKALRSYVKAGGRELEGVRIFENTSTTVR